MRGRTGHQHADARHLARSPDRLLRPRRERPSSRRATLKPGGVLFSSNPRGHNEEGWSHGRYGVYHDLDAWRRYVSVARFVELSHYYRPAGLPRERQPWLASVWRRLAS